MAIGRKTRSATARRSSARTAKRKVQATTKRSASAGTLHCGGRPAWQILETIRQESDGKQREEKLVEILSEGVYAYLKHKDFCASNRHFGAPRIELTTGGNRAGIGTLGER